MTTTQTARKTLSLPMTAKNVRNVIKAGEAEAPKVRKPRSPNRDINTFWVESLVNAGAMHRDALQFELAVGLSFIAAKGDADKATLASKKGLREVYNSAGWAAATPAGEDYKTVSRRIGATADLYAHLGGRQTIEDWIDGAPLAGQIAALVEHVKGLKFGGINDVLAYVGKPVAQKRQRKLHDAAPAAQPGDDLTEKEQLAANAAQAAINSAQGVARRSEDKLPPGRIFHAGALRVAIPFEATFTDVMELVNQLTTFAATQMPAPVAA